MKYKLVIEGNEHGFKQTLKIDSKVVYSDKNVATEFGSKRTEESPVNEDHLDEATYNIVQDTFKGYDLMRLAQEIG